MRLINIVPLFPDRIDYMVAEAKRLYAAAGLDEVMLCMTLHPEGEQPAEKVELFRRIFRQYRAALQASGIKVGILFQSLIGHGWPGAPAGVASWPRVETVDGEPSDRYCILNPDFRDYLAATVRTMAAEKPFALLVDDDFRQIDGHGLECFCPRHLAQFNAGRSIAARIAMTATTMRSSMRVKIFIFTLEGRTFEQGTRKEEVEKQLNKGTREYLNN